MDGIFWLQRCIPSSNLEVNVLWLHSVLSQALLLPETACPAGQQNPFGAPVASAHRAPAVARQTPSEVFHFESNTQADQEGPVP